MRDDGQQEFRCCFVVMRGQRYPDEKYGFSLSVKVVIVGSLDRFHANAGLSVLEDGLCGNFRLGTKIEQNISRWRNGVRIPASRSL